MNTTHELAVVAANLDPSTERIVRYLADEYGVRINAVFFRVFQDGDRQYLCRAWLRDPAEVTAGLGEETSVGEWNEEYYVSFGYEAAVVRDGLEKGYIVAGGGSWYSDKLANLELGARIWVNKPGLGYVGVGMVTQEVQPVDKFTVFDDASEPVPIAEVSPVAASLRPEAANPKVADYLVGVGWIETVDPQHAVKEKGFFGHQNIVARPRDPKWNHTIKRLKTRLDIE
jgi:hypothetical protein